MPQIGEGPADELALIEELKRRTINDITPKMREDESLWHRFLKARDFNLSAAEDMLRKHIQFRKEYGIDTILTEWKMPEVVQKYCTAQNMCVSKDGNPVVYLDFAVDAKGLVNSVKREDLIKFGCWLTENAIEIMRKQSKKLNKTVYQLIFIWNFEKITFAQATNKKALELLLMEAKIFQDNYPERIRSAYVINGSIYFSMVWSILKNFLAPAVERKFQLFGTDRWREVILQFVDANELPAFLGGKRTDPDGNPLCLSFMLQPLPIPESYYLRKSEKKLYLSPGVKRLTVTRFSKAELSFDIKVPNSYLEWEFETKSKDIAFGVYFKASSANKTKSVEIVPKQRFDTCFGPETGVYRCENPGTYILLFDNSYSWFYPKEIYYKTKINLPNEDGSEALEPMA